MEGKVGKRYNGGNLFGRMQIDLFSLNLTEVSEMIGKIVSFTKIELSINLSKCIKKAGI